jgi:hypothetical protein
MGYILLENADYQGVNNHIAVLSRVLILNDTYFIALRPNHWGKAAKGLVFNQILCK